MAASLGQTPRNRSVAGPTGGPGLSGSGPVQRFLQVAVPGLVVDEAGHEGLARPAEVLQLAQCHAVPAEPSRLDLVLRKVDGLTAEVQREQRAVEPADPGRNLIRQGVL